MAVGRARDWLARCGPSQVRVPGGCVGPEPDRTSVLVRAGLRPVRRQMTAIPLCSCKLCAYFPGRIGAGTTGDGPQSSLVTLSASVCNSASTFCESSFMYQVAQ